MIFSLFGALALVFVWLLALFPDPRVLPPTALTNEKLALLFLAVAFFVALIPPLQRRLNDDSNAATFAVLVASVVLFHIADRAGPRDGWSLTIALAPDDPLAISYATRIAVVGALLSSPAWLGAWRKREAAPEGFFGAALLLVTIIGFASFSFLSRYFAVGATETLDPKPLLTLLSQGVAYFALALCCRAAVSHLAVRGLLLKVLPFALLLAWARHQFAPIPAPVEEEE